MFKFGFANDDEVSEKDIDTKKPTIDWMPACKAELSLSQIEKQYEREDYTESVIAPGFKLKLIRSEKALHNLKEENCANIVEAESQHSDLVPAKYEGGLKIWECSYDLSQYIFEKNIDLQGKSVLDLGCGAGIIGLIALLKNSSVHFQDYNVEVINGVTIPNVLLNAKDRESALKKCAFYYGDWESFTRLNVSSDEIATYDLIFTSETIYNPDNHRKLYEVFKQMLKEDGIGQVNVIRAVSDEGAKGVFAPGNRSYIAGKSYYFGVGGGMRQFQSLIEEDGVFNVEIVWKSREGLQREILKITRKQRS